MFQQLKVGPEIVRETRIQSGKSLNYLDTQFRACLTELFRYLIL